MRLQRSNKGFILLMVLVLLVIAAVVTASLARRSCELAAKASAAQRDLQLHWGQASCRNLLLAAPNDILDPLADEKGQPALSAWMSVTLGKIRFDMLLTDEQAKANINVLARLRPAEGLEGLVQDLQATSASALHVRLRPDPAAQKASAVSVAALYVSYDQVFEYKRPSELVDPASMSEPPSSAITCWGNGKVNFKRAPHEVLHAVLEGTLDQTQMSRLRKAAQDDPSITLADAIKELKLSYNQSLALQKLMTDRSSCFSLWIVADDSIRKWYTLFVQQGGDAIDGGQTQSFGW